MAKRGFGGGMMPGNMNNLMKQAQKMQRQMEVTQKEMEEKEGATPGIYEKLKAEKFELEKSSSFSLLFCFLYYKLQIQHLRP